MHGRPLRRYVLRGGEIHLLFQLGMPDGAQIKFTEYQGAKDSLKSMINGENFVSNLKLGTKN